MSGQPPAGGPPPPLPFRTDVDFAENRQLEIHLVAWICTGVAIAVVAFKLFTRAHITKVVGWDDFFIFLSLAMSIIASAFVSYSVTLGFGRHTIAVAMEPDGPGRLVNTAMWQQLGYPFNIGAFSFPNISIAILVVRLLDPWPARARALYSMVVLQVVLALISVVIVFKQCTPTAKVWNKQLPGTCWSPDVLNDFSYFLSAYTTLTDIVLAVVPISTFWRLKMRTNTKLGVCIMMGLTLLSAVVTVVKATYLSLFNDQTDPLYDVAPLVIWGLIEQNVVIVAACIPTLRPFFHKVWKGEKSGSGSGSGSGGNSGGSGSKLGSNSTFFSKGHGNRRHRKLDDSILDIDPREQDLEAHVLGQMSHGGHGGDVGVAIGERPGGNSAAAEEYYAESHSSHKGILRTLQVNMEWDAESLGKRISRFPLSPEIPNDGRCESTSSEKDGKKKKHKSASARLTRH
ncbi:hypothetical protein PG996_012507 [Apiospora saccharicola]|uniref:Rhodopsin domain-containing protein n=1 Tax=Apiospora saccharicola TaxID=335842 RepID=A0ABR1U2S9_9PEZI